LLDAPGDALVETGHVVQGHLSPFDLHYSSPSLRIASA
jgi:hypothetical protein